MNPTFSILTTSAEMAAIYGLAVLATVIAFRICNFADLTMDGSFTLGGAVAAVSLTCGMAPALALVTGAVAGGCAGVVTALLHTRVGVNRLLAGIITMTVLYSVNIRTMGRSNMSLLSQQTLIEYLPNGNARTLGLLAMAMAVVVLLWAFLRTDLGFFMRAAGENPRVVVRRGLPEELFLLIGLFLANALSAIAGSLAAQYQGFADIGMGSGVVIAALTALLLGEAIVPPRSLWRMLVAALTGAFVYQVLIAIALRLGINPWDLKLATGLLLVFALILRKRSRTRRASENIGSDPL